MKRPDDPARPDVRRGEERGYAVADVVVGSATRPARGNSGYVRSAASFCAFSSTYRINVLSSGLRYNRRIFSGLSINRGSFESLNVFTRCERRLNARQIRLTAGWPEPHRRAILGV